MTLVMTVLTGLIYPLAVTGLCQMLFRDKANGSLITVNDQVVGSALIGQNFTKPRYFQPRPSAAGNDGYDATCFRRLEPRANQSETDRSGQSLGGKIPQRKSQLYRGPLPADLVTTSGSGLDPHISPASAAAQVDRVASARGISADQLQTLVDAHTEGRDLGFLGEPRVNVLLLNLALDRQYPVNR